VPQKAAAPPQRQGSMNPFNRQGSAAPPAPKAAAPPQRQGSFNPFNRQGSAGAPPAPATPVRAAPAPTRAAPVSLGGARFAADAGGNDWDINGADWAVNGGIFGAIGGGNVIWAREAEVKHGRVCMLAATGAIVQVSNAPAPLRAPWRFSLCRCNSKRIALCYCSNRFLCHWLCPISTG